MEGLFQEIRHNAPLILTVSVTTALGTWLCMKLLGKQAGRRKKSENGAGPTGTGKWKLYHTHTFRSARCLWVIEELRAQDDFEIIEYNPYTATQEEREKFEQEINPLNTIPALVTDNGHVMTESAAICLYLAQLYGDLLSEDYSLPNYYNWGIAGPATADTSVRVVYKNLYDIHEQHRDMKAVESNTYKCLAWIQYFENYLTKTGSKYICGNKFTAVDAIFGYDIFWASLVKGGMLLRDSPATQKYLSNLKVRPSFAKSIGTAREWMTSESSYDGKVDL